ncbi:hypothetical protein CI102_838 [Trichoderma harzianum]|nr:hypothetical protein CI102_838 [Trichoderma harzianum]
MQCVRQQCLALMGFWGPRTTAMSNEWDASPLLVLLAALLLQGGRPVPKGGGHWSYIPRVDEFGTFPAGLLLMFDLNPCWIAAAQLRGQVSARHTKATFLCHSSRSAALLPDAFCHQSHHG